MTFPEPPIRLSARLDRSVLGFGAEHDVYCLVEIGSDAAPTDRERPPYDLVLVLDGSGSMGGDQLDTAKACALFMVERLTPRDRVALVAFADEPELLVPLSGPSAELIGKIEAISACGRSDLLAGWQKGIEVLASTDERGAIRKILLLTDANPNVGSNEPEVLSRLARDASEEHGIASTAVLLGSSRLWDRSLLDHLGETDVGLRFARSPGDAPAVCAGELEGLLTGVATDASLEIRPGDGVEFESLLAERWLSEGDRTAQLGDLFAGLTYRHVFRLRVLPLTQRGPTPIGEITLAYRSTDEPIEPREIRALLVVNAVPAGETGSDRPDSEVVQEVAARKYAAVKDRWDRVLVRGTRDALVDAAAELEAMGAAAAPMAEKLVRRVAELDAEQEERQRVLDWCDRSPSGRLLVVGEAHGTVGWVPIEALPPSRAEKRTEDGRRLLMLGVARMASIIEAAESGAPAVVRREDGSEGSLGSVEGDVFKGFDWRFDPDRDFVPRPVPEEIFRWWQTHRGLVSVRCRVHGEIARFDASRSIGMLGAAWDAAVVEYHNRWERAWDGTYDTPEFDGCDVRVEPTSELGGPDLLDVKEMWIVTEGSVRPWWSYELLPGSER